MKRTRGKHKIMTLDKFVKKGYLQELNRCFLHPLGLSLGMTKKGKDIICGIVDSRKEETGTRFPINTIDKKKADCITDDWNKRAVLRANKFGYVVQSVFPKDLERLSEIGKSV